MTTHRRQRSALAFWTLVVTCAAATGCGTSLTHEQIVLDAGQGVSLVPATPSTGAQGSAPAAGAGAGPATATAAPSSDVGTTAGPAVTGGVSRQGATRSVTLPSSGGSAATPRPAVADRPTSSASANTGASVAAGAPIVIGSVGTLSGVVGQAVVGVPQAFQAWVGLINSQGGLAGHPVKLLLADDAGDSSKHLQLIQSMVEQNHVVAFVANAETTTQTQQAVDYLASKKVPTIGDELSNSFEYKSPLIFPSAAGDILYTKAISNGFAQLAKADHLSKIGLITCVEASVCNAAYSGFEADMHRVGLDPVYKTQTSVTNPDFTAQCLGARNAGAQVVSIGMDFNSVRRAITSCTQQGYHPKWISPATSKGIETDPLFQGTYLGWMTFSPFATDTPGEQEFHTAMARYQPNVTISLESPIGWLSGKLVQRAAELAKLSQNPVSSADLIRGLNAMKNDTLGGLTGPLNFPAGKTASPVLCFVGIVIQNNAFHSPTGSQPTCIAPPP